MKELNIKMYEEEIGEEWIVMNVPGNVSDSEIAYAVHMASKYAWIDEDDIKENYDELFDDMLKLKQENNGQYVFMSYLKMTIGAKFKKGKYDFEIEW